MNSLQKKYIPLEDLVDFIVDNRGKTVPTSESGIPLIATNCIKHSSIYPTFENIRYISQETYSNWFRAHLQSNDILFVNKGTPGRVCIVPNPVSFVCAQDMVGLRFKKEYHPFYMLAVLRSKEIQNTIQNNHVGLVIPHFRKQELVKLKLPILEKIERDKIGEIYFNLSSKIELNNRSNSELEQMAKTLYNYWFVQFDFPNEEGKPYKSSGGKMVYSELLKREIPEGWKINVLSEINSELVRGISPKYSEDNGIPVINQRCIRNNTIDFSLCRLHNIQLKPVKKIIKIGDILVNSTGVGTLGRVAIVKRLENSQTTVDSHVTIVRANINLVDPLFLGFSLVSKQVEIEKLGEGSTGQTELSRENLGKLPILLPKQNLQNDFASIIKPLFEKISNNEKQNLELASLRDWLLPMLMNGQVKVE
ncbi:restriction endonuclease subunit S [Chryseobacterium rhizosphaerae]|uniref:restriction endonuclease subunit S n=1 Tax=Chryseobacterium rhizosphaerae TaxID=395937 RepID=UPI0023582E1F|nr:restriction endonuclease subunit S [Chryseobacterium rhizosphaerae]MDC8099310.1 restriction endonuclease subunit S [Chryseobacterium rhizosphaerae]